MKETQKDMEGLERKTAHAEIAVNELREKRENKQGMLSDQGRNTEGMCGRSGSAYGEIRE